MVFFCLMQCFMISFNASMHRRFIKIVLVAKGKDGRDCLHKDCRCVKVLGVLGC